MWIPLLAEDANAVFSSRSFHGAKKALEKGNMTLLLADQSILSKVKNVLKGKKGCGELPTFRSLIEAEEYVSKREMGNPSDFDLPNIDNPDVTEKLKRSIDSGRMEYFITSLVDSYKNRYSQSDYGFDAANWIYQHWAETTSSRSDIDVVKFRHDNFEQNSIIATITGSSKMDGDNVVVLGAHLDSIRSDIMSHNEMKAPGADDDGSGITVLNEVIQTIVDTGYKPITTIQIMAYAYEEGGLKGSRDIARKYKQARKNVLGMLNFDMVGYNGNTDNVICFQDREEDEFYNNSDQIYFLKQLMRAYLNDIPYGSSFCGYECSDHVNWSNNGYPANIIDECEMSPFYHTKDDTVDNIDVIQISRFAQLAVVYLSEIAKGRITC